MRDPSLLVTNPTRTDPDLAPAGRHAYYVLAPVPHLEAGGPDARRWREGGLGDRYAAELLAILQARGYVGLADGIEVSHVVTPADWADAGHAAGTPFAAAHTFTPDRAVPARQPAPVTVQCGLRRLRYAARGRRADGADLREAGRPAGDRIRPVNPDREHDLVELVASDGTRRRHRHRARRAHPPGRAAPGVLGGAVRPGRADPAAAARGRQDPVPVALGQRVLRASRARARRSPSPPPDASARSWAYTWIDLERGRGVPLPGRRPGHRSGGARVRPRARGPGPGDAATRAGSG